ncbi:MAG: HPr family phosphocarrier protein [Desulfurococcaceae archaeon]
MITGRFRLKNRSGLHARPAAVFVQRCMKFKSEIIIEKGGRRANAKNILQVLALGVDFNDEITVYVDGPDEASAYAEIERLVEKELPEIDR